jgi:hypothetical protein
MIIHDVALFGLLNLGTVCWTLKNLLGELGTL